MRKTNAMRTAELPALPVGNSDWAEVKAGYWSADKTQLISGLLDRKVKVAVFTRPRRFGKTFAMRMDVHLPEGTDQSIIMVFNHRFIEKEKNQGYDPAYVMAREIGEEKGNIHYHMALFLNGQKTESIKPHLDNAWKILENIRRAENKEGGMIDACNRFGRNGIMVKRDDSDPRNLQAVQQQMSYIAKAGQKANVKGKTYFTSRTRKKK